MKTNRPVGLSGDLADESEIQNPPCPELARGDPREENEAPENHGKPSEDPNRKMVD